MGRAKKEGNKWIQEAIKNKGALHRTLGVPEGKKIPEMLAETLKKFHR